MIKIIMKLLFFEIPPNISCFHCPQLNPQNCSKWLLITHKFRKYSGALSLDSMGVRRAYSAPKPPAVINLLVLLMFRPRTFLLFHNWELASLLLLISDWCFKYLYCTLYSSIIQVYGNIIECGCWWYHAPLTHASDI